MSNGINFDAIPDTLNNVPAEGLYRGKVDKAEMRPAWVPTEPNELNMTCSLFNKDGVACGKYFETLKNNPAAASNGSQLFKIGKFVKAIGLNFAGQTVELQDICKLVQGKEFIVDISHYENPTTHAKKAQSNLFGAKGCFAPVSEFETLLNEDGALPETTIDDIVDTGDLPFEGPVEIPDNTLPPSDVELPAEDDAEATDESNVTEY